ncbi:MAG: DUF1768 domain-containing protein [Clostridia bacterium]|nr:DUF1768 domain-containing protein [Clostridia bacterium]
MQPIQIIRGSITSIAAEAVVNPADCGLSDMGRVSHAIFATAGYSQLRSACRKIGHCAHGNAVITPGFALQAKYIIHAVGPAGVRGGVNEQKQLYQAYHQALTLAAAHDCSSIAFPLLSAGVFPLEMLWKTGLRACLAYRRLHPESDMEMIFAITDAKVQETGRQVLTRLLSEQEKTQRLNMDGMECEAVFFSLSGNPDGSRHSDLSRMLFPVLQTLVQQKCTVFEDEAGARAALEAEEWGVLKKLAEVQTGSRSVIWQGCRQLLALRALEAACLQNSELKDWLSGTGSACLVACDDQENVWSCGFEIGDIRCHNLDCWSGQNLLGFTLMEVRENITNEKGEQQWENYSLR